MNLPREFLNAAVQGGAIVVGRLESIDAEGTAHVVTGAGSEPLPARSIVDFCADDAGREAVILVDPQAPGSPVILGLVRSPRADGSARAQVVADGETLTLTADREIVLSCGDASITLTRAGRIQLRGVDILSRARSTNKIKGGSIQLN